ncbi:MAG: hypothetical protein HYX91_02745 [Chloroflexi bacterium]|nr:hypothetical protein [Chloroflexota bacterium]
MPAYVRKSSIEDEFGARRTPGGAILCGHCGLDLADRAANPSGAVNVLYVDKNHIKDNRPHDVYCDDCLSSWFPKAKIV